MSLEEHQIAFMLFIGPSEEMIEADIEQGGTGSKAGDMTTELACLAIGLHHHGHGIPADERSNTPFHGTIARKWGLLAWWDGIQICGISLVGQIGTRTTGFFY